MEIILCVILGLFIGGIVGGFICSLVEGVKGALIGFAVTLVITLLCGGGMYLDTVIRDNTWNGGYCPDCEVHWTPFGVSDTDMGSGSKYYYCEECYREIEL